MQKKKIAFVMPGTGRKPIGGFKIVFEYSRRFSELGYNVTILCPAWISTNRNLQVSKLKRLVRFPLLKVYYKLFKVRWANLGNAKYKFYWAHTKSKLEKYDVIIATSIETAYLVNQLKPCVKQLYFIQGFENWSYSDQEVLASYKFNMKKIVISPWLKDYVSAVSEDSVVIPNGLDSFRFRLVRTIEKRNKFEISMLYHSSEIKGCSDSFEALRIVKNKIPELHVTMFGVYQKPQDLPEWFTYYQNPSKEIHNTLYNDSAIFISASISEGFGLTVGEAMLCGCAVACTDTGGFRMMVEDGKTGLISPVKNPEKLAENILKLIENDELRINLAKSGNNYVQQFNWDESVKKFIEVIES